MTPKKSHIAAAWIAFASALTLSAMPAGAQTQTPPSAQPVRTGAQDANAPAEDPRETEAGMIYRNLRIEQKIGHTEAIEVLKRAGYPVERIVEIR